MVARDNYKAYKSAITATSTEIVQVSDRFHLVQNLLKTTSDALVRLLPTRIELRKDRAEIVEKMKNLSPKEEERWALIQAVQNSYKDGYTIQELAETYQISRETVQAYLEKTHPISFEREKKISKRLKPYYAYVKEQVALRVKASVIFRTIQEQGFIGSYAVVREAAARLKQNRDLPDPDKETVQRPKIISCFWKMNEKLTQQERHILQAVLKGVPETTAVYAFAQLFRHAFQANDLEEFLALLQFFTQEDVKEIQRFIKTMNSELEAVKAAFLYTFNTSIVEGQINRLKLMKRMMYGRASAALLEKRVLYRG